MRILFSVIVLIFTLQSLVKADDITDFEIEGMSIGDSLLDKFSRSQIENNIYPTSFTSKKYIKVIFDSSTNIGSFINKFESLIFYMEKDDKRYVVQSINAAIAYENGFERCFEDRDLMYEEVRSLFTNIKEKNSDFNHPGDKTGNSKVYNRSFILKSGQGKVACVDFSKKKEDGGSVDHLRFTIGTNKYTQWLINEAYN